MIQQKWEFNHYMIQEKEGLLRLASLFEDEFSLDWLQELAGTRASVTLSALEEGVQNGLLVKKGPAIYVFENGVRQEWCIRVAPEEKEQLHRKIAGILVREGPSNDSMVLELARHLLQIPNDWTECQWLMRAGEIYAASFRAENALACFNKILADLSGKSGKNEDVLFFKAVIAYSDNYAGGNIPASYKSFLSEAVRRARVSHNWFYALLLEMHLAKTKRFDYKRYDEQCTPDHTYGSFGSQNRRAVDRFNRAYAKVATTQEPGLFAETVVLSTYFLFWQGRFHDVIDVYEKSVSDIPRFPAGHLPTLAAIMVGNCYTIVGEVTQGLGMLHNLRNHCLKNGNYYLASHATSSIAKAMFSINRIDDCSHYLRLCLKEAEASGSMVIRAVTIAMLSLTSFLKGDKKRSLKYFMEISPGNRFLVHDSLLAFPYLMEIYWAVETGKLPNVSGLSIETQIEWMVKSGNIFLKGIAYRYQGLLGKLRGWKNSRIISSFDLSIKWIKASGNQIELAKTLLELARYHVSLSNYEKARATISAVAKIVSPGRLDLIPDDLRPLVKELGFQENTADQLTYIADQVAVGLKSDKLLQQIITTANRVLGAERGGLLLLDRVSDKPTLALRAAKNLSVCQIFEPTFARSRGMIKEVVTSGKGRVLGISEDDNAPMSYDKEIRSCICVPLSLRKTVVGVLYHDNRLLGNVFRESDLKLLSLFASLAALELDREAAYEKLEQALKKETGSEPFLGSQDDVRSDDFHGIIGKSPAIRKVVAQVSQVSKSNLAVLITGATGVGKNVVAGVIHRQSHRAQGPFITVQCSSLPESLITSELFGHEKGAFTGATNRQIGRFELADGGTLFLDEIGDLSLDVQARLLRVLQSKEFERVGGGKEVITSDFRLIAATNRDLREEVRAGRFREDLYYRIDVFSIHVPPLNERKEDIPLLVRHFLKLYDSEHQIIKRGIPQDVMATLIRHDWPGNIRELQNVVQRAVISGMWSLFNSAAPVSYPIKGSESDELTPFK
jgi:transcriptional regulator with GAF, ATPase, and Fis domain